MGPHLAKKKSPSTQLFIGTVSTFFLVLRLIKRDQRIDDQKMLDGNPVEPMIGAGNLFNKEFDWLIVLLIHFITQALNADDVLDANRRHRHHRRRHQSDVKVAVLEREIPKAWEPKKNASALKSKH